jgi:uncharacterized coiled-coil protein SlyX
MSGITMNDLLLLIGQKEVEIALLRHQVAALTDQLKRATPPPAAPAETEPK